MDAHVFRRVSRLLAAAMSRARLERIYEPIRGVTAFLIYGSGKKQCLLFRAHRSAPVLFLTGRSPFPNPPFPPAHIMRIRKYAEGRILGEARINWIDRQMAFCLPAKGDVPENWLLLDCRNGPGIHATLDPGFEAEPDWPTLADTAGPEPWERFRTLTPHLRRTLETLDGPDAVALLVDLENGSGDLFWYGENAAPHTVSAWPLPFAPPMWEKETPVTPEAVFPMLERLGMPLLLAEMNAVAQAPEQKRGKAAVRKRGKLFEKLHEEKKRLENMFLLGHDARLLQANLWRLPADERLSEVSLPVNAEDPAGETKILRLNSLLTVTDNMETLFTKAAKASRGLAILEKRKALLRETPLVSPPAQAAIPDNTAQKRLPKNRAFSSSRIREFVSSDGFTMWRGRNAEGNRDLLRLANPFDLWLHVEDGPGAHLVIRRSHAAQEVPERTLEEAAALAGLKSWRKEDAKVQAMVALVKHVQPVKGAGPGTVTVHERIRTILARIDPALEEMLKRARGVPSTPGANNA